jgi:hypothetical protein
MRASVGAEEPAERWQRKARLAYRERTEHDALRLPEIVVSIARDPP